MYKSTNSFTNYTCTLVSLSLDLIKEVLSLDDEIQKLATELYQQKSVLIMGRGYHYATCLEGALVRPLLPSFFTHLSLTPLLPLFQIS